MKTINYNDLIILDKDFYSSGSYGFIKKCLYNGTEYALKEFKDPFYLKGKKYKISQLSMINKKELLTPKFWVKNTHGTNQYLTNWCYGKNIEAYSDYSLKEKIDILKKAKEAILVMHNENIIHADLIGSNIMISQHNEAKIIDFDNTTFSNFKTSINHVNNFSEIFIKKYGIKKEIDIFLFNLLTFSIINDCDFCLVRKNILNRNFKYFDDTESKKICNSFFLEHEIPNKDFLIDSLDETSFKI